MLLQSRHLNILSGRKTTGPIVEFPIGPYYNDQIGPFVSEGPNPF